MAFEPVSDADLDDLLPSSDNNNSSGGVPASELEARLQAETEQPRTLAERRGNHSLGQLSCLDSEGGDSQGVMGSESDWDRDSDWDAATPTPRSTSASCEALNKLSTSAVPDTKFATGLAQDQHGGAAIGGRGFDGELPELKCASCSFRVLRFAGHRWNDAGLGARKGKNIDYYFFRNFNGWSPDVARLNEGLVMDSEYAAYACQCSWQSVMGLKKMDANEGVEAAPEGGSGGENGVIRWKKM